MGGITTAVWISTSLWTIDLLAAFIRGFVRGYKREKQKHLYHEPGSPITHCDYNRRSISSMVCQKENKGYGQLN